ncbi:hypothetical protein CRG98_040559 [Punica granatum]|uniref:Uncharacterized protein n=1 Tax=Punica granatum TaxID=22663 RepID=A0A2I0I4Z3_PUNGR|nr:hypothetical protein CRG98_040559 [Punica granatum]
MHESKLARTRQGCKRHEGGGSANLLCRKVISHGLVDPTRLQEARARLLGELVCRKTRQGCKRHEQGGSANLRCSKVNSHGLADPARLQEAQERWLGELAVQKSNLTPVSGPNKVEGGSSEVARRNCDVGKHERGGSANSQCKKVNSQGLADPGRLKEARARWHGELAVMESKLARVTRPAKVARGTSETLQGCKRHERGGSANWRCMKVNSHGLADPPRLQEARARWLGELAMHESKLARTLQGCKRHERGGSANWRCMKVNSHGLADPPRLQEARARWLGELAMHESKLARTLQGCKRHERGGSANWRCMKVNSHGLADPPRLQEARARWLGELAMHESKLARTLQGCKRHERGGSANWRCMKVNSHGLADPPRLQEARARWLGELAMHESKLARTLQGCKRHERGGSANWRCMKVNSHGLADPPRLQEARARWLGELAMHESKLARTLQGCKRHERGGSANWRCMKVNSHGLADPPRLQEARARWLGELAMHESKLARTLQGCKRHERGGSANWRCMKVNSHGLADPPRLQEARARWLGELAMHESKLARTLQGCKRHERGGSANWRCMKVNSHGLADPPRLQEARARWLGELAMHESKLARTLQGCKRHERGGSANWRCMKVNSHGLADPPRLQEARARWLGELAMHESKLARTLQGCKRHERGGSANWRCMKVNSHGLADPTRLQEARARWLGELKVQEIHSNGLADPARLQEARARWPGELAVQESKLSRVSRPGKDARGTSETRQGCKRHERGGSANLRCMKVKSHGFASLAKLQEPRARWLGELAMQDSKLAWISRPGKVASGTKEVAQRTCGAGKKVSFHGLADRARMQEARARWLGELAVQENPARLQEARGRWLSELAMQDSKLAWISRPGKVARGTSKVARRTCGAAKKVSSHGLADPARLQEARARWLGELAVEEIKLARVSKPSKVERGQCEVARQTCGVGNFTRTG